MLQVRGIVAYDTGIARVYPAVPAEIRQIHVRYGQLVPAGAPLVVDHAEVLPRDDGADQRVLAGDHDAGDRPVCAARVIN